MRFAIVYRMDEHQTVVEFFYVILKLNFENIVMKLNFVNS